MNMNVIMSQYLVHLSLAEQHSDHDHALHDLRSKHLGLEHLTDCTESHDQFDSV